VRTEIQGATPQGLAEKVSVRLGSFQARPQVELVLTVRVGGSRRPLSPCLRCRDCVCQRNRDYSAAQDSRSPTSRRPSHSRRRSSSSRRRSTSRRRPTRAPKRDTSSGPPQLWREEAQPEGTSAIDEGALSWDEAHAQFGLGAGPMSQGSGSPVNLIENETCDEILQGLRGADGQLPSFGSDPGSPLQRWRPRWPTASGQLKPPPCQPTTSRPTH